jgi:hypothetical protein
VSYQRGMEEKRQEYITAEDKARRGNKVRLDRYRPFDLQATQTICLQTDQAISHKVRATRPMLHATETVRVTYETCTYANPWEAHICPL